MLNINFNRREVIDSTQQEWIADTTSDVWRKSLAGMMPSNGHTAGTNSEDEKKWLKLLRIYWV